MTVTPLERRAFHESGHAVLALREGREIRALTIDSAMGGGFCDFTRRDDSPESVRAELRITLAGALAEDLARPTRATSVLTADEEIYGRPGELALARASERREAESGAPEMDGDACSRMVADLEPDDPDAELELQRELAWRTLVLDSDLLHRLAAYLTAWRTLSPGDIQEILEGSPSAC